MRSNEKESARSAIKMSIQIEMKHTPKTTVPNRKHLTNTENNNQDLNGFIVREKEREWQTAQQRTNHRSKAKHSHFSRGTKTESKANIWSGRDTHCHLRMDRRKWG